MQGLSRKTPEVLSVLKTSVSSMVHVRGGWFDMGNGNGLIFEKPVHKVHIDDFYMGKFTVTRELFREFIEETGYQTDAEKGEGSFVVTLTADWRKKATPAGSIPTLHNLIIIRWCV